MSAAAAAVTVRVTATDSGPVSYTHLDVYKRQLVRLLRHLDRYYNLLLSEGSAPIIRRFSEVSSYYQGKRVRIMTANDSFVGTTKGLEPSGILRVARDDGRVVTVISGDVTEA